MPIIFGHSAVANRAAAVRTSALTKHMTIIGQTGSGKTGVLIGLAEQLADQDIPVILVDIKGDLINIAQQPDDKASAVARRAKMNLRYITPGGTHGEPVNLFRGIQSPERRHTAVTQILRMVGAKSHALQNREHVFLSRLLEHYHNEDPNRDIDVVGLIAGLQTPPYHMQDFGAMELEDYFPRGRRNGLATKFNNLLMAPSFTPWQTGDKFDVDSILTNRPGKTNVTIWSVNHLPDDEKMFAIAVLFDAIVAWMNKQEGTDKLRACLMVDECAGILPPYPKNPPTKASVMKMLKQGRGFGFGTVLASQNPMDIDYKAMSNCATWIVGRLITSNDRRRVVEAVCASTPYDKRIIEQRIARLDERNFVLVRPKSTVDFYSKDVDAKLTGPMTNQAVQKAMQGY
jgi:hypothetical protein